MIRVTHRNKPQKFEPTRANLINIYDFNKEHVTTVY